MARLACGEMVLVSSTTAPGQAPSSRPSGPLNAAWTLAGLGSETTIASQPAASSRALAVATAPSAAARATFSPPRPRRPTEAGSLISVASLPMQLRTFGRTGVKVSPLCLGAMMFGAWGNPDHDESIDVIHAALDAGINFIDTADVY